VRWCASSVDGGRWGNGEAAEAVAVERERARCGRRLLVDLLYII
jgi:hypothetical protein